MFWHPQLRQIVLGGHARDTLMLGWNGTAWQELGNGVDQRANYALAYDSNRDRLVVHGGKHHTPVRAPVIITP